MFSDAVNAATINKRLHLNDKKITKINRETQKYLQRKSEQRIYSPNKDDVSDVVSQKEPTLLNGKQQLK
jgi:hypothetical protein